MKTRSLFILSLNTVIALVSGCRDSDATGPFDSSGYVDTDWSSTGLTSDATSAGSDSDSGSPTSSTGEMVDEFDLDAYIDSLGHLPVLPQKDPMEQNCEGEQCLENDPDSGFDCTYTYYNAVDHFEEFVATSPNSNALFAGATVHGEQAQNGLLALLGTLPRAEITASVSLPNLQGPVDFTYNPQNLSEYRNGLNSVLSAELDGNSPTVMQFQMRRVFSEDDLALVIGANFEWLGNKVSNLFEFEKSTKKTLLAVSATESYFTVDINTPLESSDYFAEGIDEDEAKSVMFEGNPPMVIPSVTYGRSVLFSSSSDRNEQEVRDAFSAAFNFVGKGEAEVSLEQRAILDEQEMKVLVMGGDKPVQTILGYEGLIQFILDGKGFSKSDRGVPIGYKLMHLDGHDMTLALATEYAEADCVHQSTPGSRLWVERLEVPENGQALFKGKMVIDVWGVDTDGNSHTFFTTNGQPIKVGDGDVFHIQKHHDFYVDAPQMGADYVQVCFKAQEENKIVEGCDKVTYNGESYPPKGGTIWDKDGNLKVGLSYSFTAAP